MKQFLASLMMLCLLSTADAGFVDEFAGGIPQQIWTFNGLPANSSIPTFSALSGGYLELGNGVAVGNGGDVAAFGFVAETFGPQGIVVRANLNPNGAGLSRDVGVLAYLDPQALNAYGLTVDYISGEVDMSKITGGATNPLTAAIQIPNFSATNSYDIELEVVGGSVIGRVYDSANNLLSTMQGNDFDYTMGLAGIVVNRSASDPTLQGTFGRVSAVPEPSGIGLLTGLAILLIRARRRQQS